MTKPIGALHLKDNFSCFLLILLYCAYFISANMWQPKNNTIILCISLGIEWEKVLFRKCPHFPMITNDNFFFFFFFFFFFHCSFPDFISAKKIIKSSLTRLNFYLFCLVNYKWFLLFLFIF